MNNRITRLFKNNSRDLLNIYFTAGFPELNDTEQIILNLEKQGVDLIEIGMPFSDPLADGPTIQESGTQALKNGMNLPLLFDQLKSIRERTEIPLILMGYLNQVMQYGEEAFIQKCQETGIDGVILPDLPLYEYEQFYKKAFEKANLSISFLVTPQTGEERIREVDRLTTGFIYVVSDSSITGSSKGISEEQQQYFERIKALPLRNPTMIGFGISDSESYRTACQYARGAIVGSAFIRALRSDHNLEETVKNFVSHIRK